MNVVAGYLLYISGCDEKNTFRSLVKLMEIMKFSYCKDMPLIDLISKLVHHQLRKYFPLIEKRLL